MKRFHLQGMKVMALAILLGISLLCFGCATPTPMPSEMAGVSDGPLTVVAPLVMAVGRIEPTGAGAVKTPSYTEDASSVPVIMATGSGASEAEARADALSSLSSTLYSRVESTLEVDDRIAMAYSEVVATASHLSKQITVSTNLPILGVVVETTYTGDHLAPLYHAEAELSSSLSLPLYVQELDRLAQLINTVDLTVLETSDSLTQERQLSLLLARHDQYEKLSYVGRALGLKELPPLTHPRSAVEIRLAALAEMNDSYAKGARSLTRGIVESGVYVYPAQLDGRGAVTEFAEQLAWAMQDALGAQSTYNPERASYFLVGRYTLVDDGEGGIHVSYRLEDRGGNVLATSMASLMPAVYEGQRFIPTAYDFQKQLERGEAVDTSFKVEIRINGKKEYLSFHPGDELIIEAKANQICSFYLVGYVFNDRDERFAYLFPLKLDAVGKEMFVHRVSADQVGQWIIINPTWRGSVQPIEIIEPYGLEALQLYASTERDYQRFLETVPGFRETEEYYIVSDDPEEGLALTRALNIKGVADSASGETVVSEASVMFKTGE